MIEKVIAVGVLLCFVGLLVCLASSSYDERLRIRSPRLGALMFDGMVCGALALAIKALLR